MDETISKWIIEFLIRKNIPDKFTNTVLSSLPLSSHDYRLQKTILLRRVELETSNGSVSEKLLELIGTIEALDDSEGKPASDVMREAYCLVAADCTVRFLEENEEENEKYVEAVERVWRRKVCVSEGLCSELARKWMGELEVAAKDGEVCERVLRRNTRKDAIKAVKMFLKEAWEELGPSFLEVAAAKFGGGIETVLRGNVGGSGVGNDGNVVCSDNPCREMVAVEGTQNGPSQVRRKHVAMKGKRQRGAKISDTDEELTNNVTDGTTQMEEVQDAAAEVNREQEATISGSKDPSPWKNCLSDNPHAGQTLSSALPAESNKNPSLVQKAPVMLSTPEVDRVQVALKDSTRVLHSVVCDPLPEALEAAQTLSKLSTRSSDTAVGNQTRTGTNPTTQVLKVQEQNMTRKTRTSMRSDAVVLNQGGPEICEVNNSTAKEAETSEKQDNIKETAQRHETEDASKLQVGRKRSLMEANGTDHTFEWDDSIENTSPTSSNPPRLPSPRARRNSPLKVHENRKFAMRRERKRWTSSEEDTLRTGVKKFGRGNWKLILHCYHDTFQDRTEVDLKDKWRNLMKYPG